MSKLKTENIVISTSPWLESDLKTIYEDEEVYFTETQEIGALMKELGIYKSISEARRANRMGDIPKGYTEFKASKKVVLYIWNPTE